MIAFLLALTITVTDTQRLSVALQSNVTIILERGVYHVDIDLTQDSLTLIGQSGAILEGNIRWSGANITLRNLEIRQHWSTRWQDQTGSVWYGPQLSLSVHGANAKIIDCYIHDIVNIGLWSDAPDSEFIGNVVQNVGWLGPSNAQGYGHDLYIQNKTGFKRIKHNVFLPGYGYTVHAYSQAGWLNNLSFISNVGVGINPWLIGGWVPVNNLIMRDNYIFAPTELGYDPTVMNGSALVDHNHIQSVAFKAPWQDMKFWDNTIGPENTVTVLRNDASERTWLLVQNAAHMPEVWVQGKLPHGWALLRNLLNPVETTLVQGDAFMLTMDQWSAATPTSASAPLMNPYPGVGVFSVETPYRILIP